MVAFFFIWSSLDLSRLPKAVLKDGSLMVVLLGGAVYFKGETWFGHWGKFLRGILVPWSFLCFPASRLPCGEQVSLQCIPATMD